MLKDRPNLIFDAIEQILEESDLSKLTYANISRICHLHTNTITYYFDSKEDMLLQFFLYIVNRDTAQLPEYYSCLPNGMSPSEAICKLVDHIIDGGLLKSRTRRLLNKHMLPICDTNVKIRDFLYELQHSSVKLEHNAVLRLLPPEAHLREETRAALSDLTQTSSGLSLIVFFDVLCPDLDFSVSNAKIRIKRLLLGDDDDYLNKSI